MRIASDNIPLIKEALKKRGIFNESLISAIVAVIGKESNYKPIAENLNYTLANIQKTFPAIPANIAPLLVKKPVELANYVYSNKYGNGDISSGDGFKYRGRGFNQITFKDTYYKLGKALGIDLVNNPDLLLKPEIAAEATAIFYKNVFFNNRSLIAKKYGIDILKPIPPNTDPYTLLKIAVNATAGFGKAESIVNSEYGKALRYFRPTKQVPIVPILIGITLLTLLINKA
jgi:putative chitinase